MSIAMVDRIVRETSPVFGLPPYWWRAVDGNCSYVSRLPSKKLYSLPAYFTESTAEERADCFAVIVGKSQTTFQGRDDILRATGVGSGTYAVASLRWQAMKDLHQFYRSLAGEQGNEARKEFLEPWKTMKTIVIPRRKRKKNSGTS